MIEPALNTATPAPEEDVTTALYRAAIGPVSNGYYLPIFTRFEAADHAGISWNTAAALSTLNWLAFRHLWGAALAYFGTLVAIVLLVFGIGRLVFQLPDVLVGALALGFGLAAFVLPGLFGNAVFHTDCRKRMSKALVAHSNVGDACAELTRKASTRKRAIILAAANGAFWLLAALLYWQLSSLSNLTVMPQGALEAGHVAVGRTTNMVPAASTPVALPTPAAPPVALAGSTPVTITAAASEAASAPQASASLAVAVPVRPSASAPVVAASKAMTMAMVDTVRQDTPVQQEPAKPLTKPAVKAEPAAPSAKASTPKKAVRKAPPEKSAKPHASPSAPTAAAAASSTAKPYFVNVGLFAVAANAERAHAKLMDAQLPSQRKELRSSKGPLVRVRVGPFASKAEALAASGKIKALALDAIVVQP